MPGREELGQQRAKPISGRLIKDLTDVGERRARPFALRLLAVLVNDLLLNEVVMRPLDRSDGCTGADLAGTSRMQYPSNVRVLKFPCTGRIDPVFILKAFQQGADGVLVSGCHPGDCHYIAGNFHARRRFAVFRKLLEFVGVNLDRLQFSWVSAAEGGKWVEVVTDLTEKVRAMGPMVEFKELAMEEQWSGTIDTPELKEAYNQI